MFDALHTRRHAPTSMFASVHVTPSLSDFDLFKNMAATLQMQSFNFSAPRPL
jgi:hypothetical protein